MTRILLRNTLYFIMDSADTNCSSIGLAHPNAASFLHLQSAEITWIIQVKFVTILFCQSRNLDILNMVHNKIKMMNYKLFILLFSTVLITSCVSRPPPRDINNICNIFKQYPQWYIDAKDVEKRWKVPVPVQMAIIHQESKFDASARPPRTKLLWVIPWKRPSSAYGYTQALRSTWKHYKEHNGSLLSSRSDFADGVDFIGWYANQAAIRAHIPRSDAYLLYLAYHEGVGGYQRKTYLKKPWLISVARKVKAKSQTYAMQLNACQGTLKSHSWF